MRSPRASDKPNRRHHRRVDYREPSSDESFDEAPGPHIPGPSRVRTSRPHPSVQRASKQPPKSSQSGLNKSVKRAVARSDKAKRRLPSNQQAFSFPNPFAHGGVIPPWQTLPYHVLLQIFAYASYPLRDEVFQPRSTVAWLLSMARVCRAFTEPALANLYYSPPLVPSWRAHSLVKSLDNASPRAMTNYGNKIHRLEIEVIQTLAYSLPGQGHFELHSLIQHSPQLQDLEIYHINDRPPYRDSGKTTGVKWRYPDSLFAVLESMRIRLRSFRWNAIMAGPNQSTESSKTIHETLPFRDLQKLCYVNYHTVRRRAKESPTPSEEHRIADAISVLPNLKSLAFETCSTVNEVLLPLLPQNLTSLSIINCFALTSDMLDSFLVTHGRQLKELVLHHNQSLSVSFLTDLADACPKLEVLNMDLRYYSSQFSYNDSEPRFDALLLPGEVPTWPSTLREIELEQLRKWDVETAETFFSSLISSAGDLPHMRKLVLKAILHIGWRDRANFRDKWIRRLSRVFLRKSEPPDPQLSSLRKYREMKRSASTRNAEIGGTMTTVDGHSPGSMKRPRLGQDPANEGGHTQPIGVEIPIRRSSRLVKSQNDDESSSERSRSSRRRKLRASNSSKAAAISSDEEFSNEAECDEGGISRDRIQGLCEVVDVRIDNLRPTEEQFNEDDFLDSEASGDEDWTGEDHLPGEDRYAW